MFIFMRHSWYVTGTLGCIYLIGGVWDDKPHWNWIKWLEKYKLDFVWYRFLFRFYYDIRFVTFLAPICAGTYLAPKITKLLKIIVFSTRWLKSVKYLNWILKLMQLPISTIWLKNGNGYKSVIKWLYSSYFSQNRYRVNKLYKKPQTN